MTTIPLGTGDHKNELITLMTITLTLPSHLDKFWCVPAPKTTINLYLDSQSLHTRSTGHWAPRECFSTMGAEPLTSHADPPFNNSHKCS